MPHWTTWSPQTSSTSSGPAHAQTLAPQEQPPVPVSSETHAALQPAVTLSAQQPSAPHATWSWPTWAMECPLCTVSVRPPAPSVPPRTCRWPPWDIHRTVLLPPRPPSREQGREEEALLCLPSTLCHSLPLPAHPSTPAIS